MTTINSLFDAMQEQPTAFTANGMPTLVTSGNTLLDLFGIIGNRGFDFDDNFLKLKSVYNSDKIVLGRLLLWSRDCRGGAGHRDPIRKFILQIENTDSEYAIALTRRLPELGYYKDLIHLYEKSNSAELKQAIVDLFIIELYNASKEKRYSLLAKYLPRKGELAVKFRDEFKMQPKQYRKMIVSLSKTVEQQMCAKDWDGINFEQVPSVAMMRYRKAFERHGDNFQKYQDRVVKGEAKINSAQLTPGEIVSKANGYTVSNTETKYLTNAWNALPDYLNGSKERWLPLIDVSGSMNYSAGGNSSITCMDVAIGLGLYLAERNKGLFKDQFITFSEYPSLIDLKRNRFNTIVDKIKFIKKSDWGYNTDIEKVFDLILNAAVKHNIKQSQMPEKLVIFSDMEFDSATGIYDSKLRIFKLIDKKYKRAGYKRPDIIFWNLQGRSKNMTVNVNDFGTCQISGYTPAILKNLTNLEKFTPMTVMIDTLSSSRYDF